jgi:DcaP outer membrane protein
MSSRQSSFRHPRWLSVFNPNAGSPRRPLRKSALHLAVGGVLAASAPFAYGQSIDQLKTQIDALQRKLEEIEKKQKAAAAESQRKITEIEKRTSPENIITAGDTPGSFKLPGLDTSVLLYGYVKLDAVYSNPAAVGANNAGNLFLSAQTIPIGPTRDFEKSELTFGAQQSRFGLSTYTPTTFGPLTTQIETDFYGGNGNQVVSNSYNLRLRLAWGTLGSFGAGQYWTNFMNTAALPDLIDFGGPVGQIFIRQSQVRWTQRFANGEWAVSAENPESVISTPGTPVTSQADDDRWPDFVGSVKFNTSAGQYYIAALARNVRVNTAAAASEKWGLSIQASGRVPVLGRDDIRFAAYGGNSIGRYQSGFYVDGVVNTAGNVELPSVIGGYVGYRHLWSDKLRSTLSVSTSRANNPSGTFGTINQGDKSTHVNLIWSPWKKVDLGLEYIYAKREIENGQSGALNRVQFGAKYDF